MEKVRGVLTLHANRPLWAWSYLIREVEGKEERVCKCWIGEGDEDVIVREKGERERSNRVHQTRVHVVVILSIRSFIFSVI